jgi:hypothetical protein
LLWNAEADFRPWQQRGKTKSRKMSTKKAKKRRRAAFLPFAAGRSAVRVIELCEKSSSRKNKGLLYISFAPIFVKSEKTKKTTEK